MGSPPTVPLIPLLRVLLDRQTVAESRNTSDPVWRRALSFLWPEMKVVLVDEPGKKKLQEDYRLPGESTFDESALRAYLHRVRYGLVEETTPLSAELARLDGDRFGYCLAEGLRQQFSDDMPTILAAVRTMRPESAHRGKSVPCNQAETSEAGAPVDSNGPEAPAIGKQAVPPQESADSPAVAGVSDAPATGEFLVLFGIGRNEMRRDGASWILQYGEEHGTFPAKDFSALEIVAKLVALPNHPLELKDLVDAATRTLFERPEAAAHVLDQPAIADLRRRYNELKLDRDKETDPLVREENERNLGQIAAELQKAVGPGGRKRKLGQTPEDLAWDGLTKNLRRLWPRLRKAFMPNIAKHLKASVHFNRPQVTYHPQSGTPPLTAAE